VNSTVASHGSYRPIKKIFSGGMADIILCTKMGAHGFQKQFIIKKIAKDLLENEEAQQLFINEMKIHSLLYHPNIVQLFDFKENNATFLLILEYVPGRSLRSLISQIKKNSQKVPLSWCLSALCDCALALSYLHELKDKNGAPLGLIHRDLSPDNILLTPQGTAKICDFGLSKGLLQNVHTQTGLIRGKLNYMAPEQLKGEKVNFKSDLFSLALCFAELISSKNFHISSIKTERDRDLLVKDIVNEHSLKQSSALAHLLNTALQKNAIHRFINTPTFLNACHAAYRESLIQNPEQTFTELESLFLNAQLPQSSCGKKVKLNSKSSFYSPINSWLSKLAKIFNRNALA